MEYKIAVIPGDGIGPEVVRETLKVLDQVSGRNSDMNSNTLRCLQEAVL